MNTKVVALRQMFATLLLSAFASLAHATIVWNWSFGSEAGQFVTSGELNDGTAAAGSYLLEDFSVTSSAYGATLGSMSGGQYVANAYGTTLPYAFTWDGSSVTMWDSAGINTYDWWVFGSPTYTDPFYFFSWRLGNVNDPTSSLNDPTSAGLYSGSTYSLITQGAVQVAPAITSVPEPAPLVLFGVGLIALAFSQSKRRLG